MSYRRKPRCSFCRQEGHNRTNCPTLKAKIKERLEANPNDWWATQQMERSKPKTAADRTCSYCNQKGHTRRTCEVKKKDIAYMKQYLLDGRKAVAEVCEKHPNLIGKGDMFIHSGKEWNDGEYKDFRRPFVVTSIRFSMSNTQPMAVLKALIPDAHGQMKTGLIPLRKILNNETEQNWNFAIKPASKSGKPLNFSDKWLHKGIADLDKDTAFKGGKKKSEKQRQWEVYSVVDGEKSFTYESLMIGVLDG
jgi:hypothetical protein